MYGFLHVLKCRAIVERVVKLELDEEVLDNYGYTTLTTLLLGVASVDTQKFDELHCVSCVKCRRVF